MATINSFYREHAMEYATVSEDNMVVTLPSEKKADVCYEVRCEHAAKGVEAVSCQCFGFGRYHRCKHLVIVNEWLKAQAPVEPKITEIEPNAWYIVNSNTSAWRNEDGQWMFAGPTENAVAIVEAYLEKQQVVKEAEQIIAQPVIAEPAIEVAVEVPAQPAMVASLKSDSEKLASILAEQKVDLGTIGHLTRNEGFRLLR